jgi:hypothetical protein
LAICGGIVVAGAELAQHGLEALARDGVDLVEEERERPRARARPGGEGGAQHPER